MRHYFAPLEGITDSIYRRLHHQYFPGLDRYYMPFFSPTIHRQLTPREDRELPYADSVGFEAVPQIMTKVPEDFLWAAQQCLDRGYKEVNINLGCPSGTVVSKGKGAGMLRDPDALDRFLDAIYEKAPLPVSVKTRIGINEPEEFPRLLEIYNRYPICELTVHPRVRKVFYNGSVDMDSFAYCYENSKAPLCFNGNLTSRKDIARLQERFPRLGAVMLGRALVGDPAMLSPKVSDIDTLQAFTDALLEEYIREFGGARNAMFRLKENWRFILCMFDDNQKLRKKLLKTTDVQEFRSITNQILHTLPLRTELAPDWDL